MSIPRISIIVPVFKVEQYLRRCLDSIKSQTFTEWECILIDDGSPDNSAKICDEYVEEDKRFNVIHQTNQGVSVARNTGIDVARGEWITFVDSDDWIESNMLEALYNAALQNGAEVVLSGYYRTNGKKKLEEYLPQSGWFNMPKDFVVQWQPPWAKLFLRSTLSKNLIKFPEGIELGEDFYFTFSVYFVSQKIYVLDSSLYYYYINSKSAVNTINVRKIDDEKSVVTKIEKSLTNEQKNIQEWNDWITEKKMYSKNLYALRLPKPDAMLWKSCYPELTDKVIEQSRGLRRLFFRCLAENKKLLVYFIFSLIKLRRIYLYKYRQFKIFPLKVTGSRS